ncbi:MAG TPA: RlpA-like double-psi beta-barrel domain-containing protein [Actinomycetota bacterium]|nr:RlpA-like double-psi beta-barrel domain-containing protein [Actinomycetota bacterium]
MDRSRLRWLLGATAVLLLVRSPAGAQETLEEAQERLDHARAEVEALEPGVEALSRRYAELQHVADEAAAALVDAYLAQTDVEARVAAARSLLNERADAVYRAGPAAFVDVLLGSESLGDMVVRQEMIQGALTQGVGDAAEAMAERQDILVLRGQIEERRRELAERQQELAELRTIMEIRLAEARAKADAAEEDLEALERQLFGAASLEGRYLELIQADGELGGLLQLLGPDGGRGCEIPPALEATGRTFSGEASFYGEEFAGNPTAIGHIFNPALFTAAHRTLPLPSFLHVQYGQRCATVLLNDRGPYVDGRILDLAEGPAMYLGLPGVGIIHAEILAPVQPVPVVRAEGE